MLDVVIAFVHALIHLQEEAPHIRSFRHVVESVLETLLHPEQEWNGFQDLHSHTIHHIQHYVGLESDGQECPLAALDDLHNSLAVRLSAIVHLFLRNNVYEDDGGLQADNDEVANEVDLV